MSIIENLTADARYKLAWKIREIMVASDDISFIGDGTGGSDTYVGATAGAEAVANYLILNGIVSIEDAKKDKLCPE